MSIVDEIGGNHCNEIKHEAYFTAMASISSTKYKTAVKIVFIHSWSLTKINIL